MNYPAATEATQSFETNGLLLVFNDSEMFTFGWRLTPHHILSLQHSGSVSTSELHGSDEYDHLLSKGSLFHEETKILLAEKFIEVEFWFLTRGIVFSSRETVLGSIIFRKCEKCHLYSFP